jgi:hypothetical protein
MTPPLSSRQFAMYFEDASLLFWLAVGVFEYGLKSKAPLLLRVIFWLPGKFLRVGPIVLTFGVLSACSNPDPLAVASGPLYQLNTGYWQPAPQDLSAPPRVTHN